MLRPVLEFPVESIFSTVGKALPRAQQRSYREVRAKDHCRRKRPSMRLDRIVDTLYFLFSSRTSDEQRWIQRRCYKTGRNHPRWRRS